MRQTRTITFIIHLTGWLLLFLLLFLFTNNAPGPRAITQKLFTVWCLIFFAVYISFFYLNAQVLIPIFYLKKKIWAYVIILLVCLAGIYFLRPFDHLVSTGPPPGLPPPGRDLQPRRGERLDIMSLILFVMTWSLSTAITINRQWLKTQAVAARAETDRVRAELTFLKAHINPHFLFNTLNNIYSLAETKSDKTSDSILKLSNIMRYVTDDAIQDFVSLQHELDCIRDYIDLQRLRLSEKTEVDFSVTGIVENKQIAPLLLMTFVENVFKHGISNHEAGRLVIRIDAKENSIHFYSMNPVYASTPVETRIGTGIANARRRLDFLYPGKHSLDIKEEEKTFVVNLTLHLS